MNLLSHFHFSSAVTKSMDCLLFYWKFPFILFFSVKESIRTNKRIIYSYRTERSVRVRISFRLLEQSSLPTTGKPANQPPCIIWSTVGLRHWLTGRIFGTVLFYLCSGCMYFREDFDGFYGSAAESSAISRADFQTVSPFNWEASAMLVLKGDLLV